MDSVQFACPQIGAPEGRGQRGVDGSIPIVIWKLDSKSPAKTLFDKIWEAIRASGG